MKANIFVCLLGVALITGCGDKGSSNGGGGKANPKTKDLTNTKECVGAPYNGNLISDNWQAAQEDNGVQLTTTLTPDPAGNAVTLSTVCEQNGEAAQVFVRVAANITDKQIEILEEKKDEQTNGKVTCSIALPKMTLDYVMVGNCLKVSAKGETHFFVKTR